MHSEAPPQAHPRIHLDLFVDTMAEQETEVERLIESRRHQGRLGPVPAEAGLRRSRRPRRQPVLCRRPQQRAIRQYKLTLNGRQAGAGQAIALGRTQAPVPAHEQRRSCSTNRDRQTDARKVTSVRSTTTSAGEMTISSASASCASTRRGGQVHLSYRRRRPASASTVDDQPRTGAGMCVLERPAEG